MRFATREDVLQFMKLKLEMMKKDAEIIEKLNELLNDGVSIDHPIIEEAVATLMGWNRMI